MPNPITIPINNPIPLPVRADEPFSGRKIAVRKGETYVFSCNDQQRWKDAYRETTPKGFFNFFAWLAGLRVKKVNCFCLCACFDEKIETAFAIGRYLKKDIDQDGVLAFFPNDTEGYYHNNSGSIVLQVHRTG